MMGFDLVLVGILAFAGGLLIGAVLGFLVKERRDAKEEA